MLASNARPALMPGQLVGTIRAEDQTLHGEDAVRLNCRNQVADDGDEDDGEPVVGRALTATQATRTGFSGTTTVRRTVDPNAS